MQGGGGIQNIYLTTAFTSAKLSSFSVTEIKVTTDDSFIQFCPADISHTSQGFCMSVVLYEAEAARCPVSPQQHGETKEDLDTWNDKTDLVLRSRPIIILFIPPPFSGFVHFVNSS
jgi:hypothetical protein